MSLLDVPVNRIDGTPGTLAEHAGKVLLVVNVASQCGMTPQYDGLEALYRRYRDRGLVVVGFPANDFGAQEPGTDAEIETFCRSTYGVDFPMYSKITVKGPDKHPLYQALTAAKPMQTFKEGGSPFVQRRIDRGVDFTTGEVLWNFEKFLVDRKGNVVQRFGSDVVPEDAAMVAAVEEALAA